jgi:hypothetical protein
MMDDSNFLFTKALDWYGVGALLKVRASYDWMRVGYEMNQNSGVVLSVKLMQEGFLSWLL